MKAVAEAVRLWLTSIMLHRFLYCAQVHWEKRCLYNKSCSYGNQDECRFVENTRVCLAQTALESIRCARATVNLCLLQT